MPVSVPVSVPVCVCMWWGVREIGQDRAAEKQGDGECVQVKRDFPFEVVAELGRKRHGSDEGELRHGHERGGVLAAHDLRAEHEVRGAGGGEGGEGR